MPNNPSSFYIDVKELRGIGSETVHRLPVRWWTSIKEIKDQLRSHVHSLPSQQHIFFSKKSMELSNFLTLHDIGIESSGSVLRVSCDSKADNFSLSYSDKFEPDTNCMELINEVKRGLERNRDPGKSDLFDGTSGVYFMRSGSGATVAVFKPRDEEQGMPNNPKDHAGVGAVGLRENITPGEGCIREQAAYLFDINHFSRVPHTTLVHCMHPAFHYPGAAPGKRVVPVPKLGSLQRYMRSEGAFDDFGYNFFSDLEVQRIALLDLRLLNCDRNEANILVQRKMHDDEDDSTHSNTNNHDQNTTEDSDSMDEDDSNHSKTFTEWLLKADSHEDFRLIPIDHGYCLPTRLKISSWDWTWFNAPQISRPIHPEIKAYMKSIDIDAVIMKLRPQIQLPENCFFLVRIAHQVIMEGIDAGLTLKDIAKLIAREDDETPSRLELAITEAEENALRSLEIHNMTRGSSPAITTNTNMEGSLSFLEGFQSSNDLEKYGSNSEKTTSESIDSTPQRSPDLSPLKFTRKLSPGKYTPLLPPNSPRLIRGTPLLPVHEHDSESVTGSCSETEDDTSSSTSSSPTDENESNGSGMKALHNLLLQQHHHYHHHENQKILTRITEDNKLTVNYGMDYLTSIQAISGKPLYAMQTLDSVIQPQLQLHTKKGLSAGIMSNNSLYQHSNNNIGSGGGEDVDLENNNNGFSDKSCSSTFSLDAIIPPPPPSSTAGIKVKVGEENDNNLNYFPEDCNDDYDVDQGYEINVEDRNKMNSTSPLFYVNTASGSTVIRCTTSSPALEFIDSSPYHHHYLHTTNNDKMMSDCNGSGSNGSFRDGDYNIEGVNFDNSPLVLERKSYVTSTDRIPTKIIRPQYSNEKKHHVTDNNYFQEGQKNNNSHSTSSNSIYPEIDLYNNHTTTTASSCIPVQKKFSTSSVFSDLPCDDSTTTTSLIVDSDSIASYSPILRVASFAGFNSKPLYELSKTERRYSTLKRDRFKRLECTFEFQNSRLQFALEAVKVLISRIMKTL